jgi:hypothetical protein
MKAAAAPRVSIIVPFFNAERFFDAALDSIFGQTVQDWELLLIDDGSRVRARREHGAGQRSILGVDAHAIPRGCAQVIPQVVGPG